ncbi:MAG: hypothetical protein IT529_10515 [Burkholderiales bacterium]|nr:hypothetical protein [Burkholderiales bacterium]
MLLQPRHAIHRIEHDEVRCQLPPAIGRRAPPLRIVPLRAQPPFKTEPRSVASVLRDFPPQQRELALGFRVRRHDRHPPVADAEAQPPAAEQIDFNGLLGDQPGLALRRDQYAALVCAAGYEPDGSGTAEFRTWIERDFKRYGEIIRVAGIKAK